MKKYVIASGLLLVLATVVYAAVWDTAYNELITPADDDLLLIQDVSGSDETKYIELQNLGSSLTDDQTAIEVNITDAGGYFVGTEVETAQQEIGADVLLNNVKVTDDDLGVNETYGPLR